MNEKIEFLSRQHIDFKTFEGMKQLIQAITWRAKVETWINQVTIHVRKKKVSEIRRLAKEFGMANVKYNVKEIGWRECWFRRFQVVDIKMLCGELPGHTVKNEIIKPEKQWCAFDLAAKGSRDYSAKATLEKKDDGSFELVDMELIKPEVK